MDCVLVPRVNSCALSVLGVLYTVYCILGVDIYLLYLVRLYDTPFGVRVSITCSTGVPVYKSTVAHACKADALRKQNAPQNRTHDYFSRKIVLADYKTLYENGDQFGESGCF